MHYAVLERWSRGESPLHRRDPRAKIGALLVLLIVLATAHHSLPEIAAGIFLLLAGTCRWARVPLAAVLLRAGIVLPFTLVFAGASWLTGDPARGIAMLLKAYLSAFAVLLTVATTPVPLLVRALESAGTPRFLLLVAQFLYRYLFVVSEEAQLMVRAAAARGATLGGLVGRKARFRAAAGALAVLFARSYGRAEDVHRAMLARGFTGRLGTLAPLNFRRADAVFLLIGSLVPVLLRIGLERIG